MKTRTEKTFHLSESESLNIERLHCINESYKDFVAVLAKSFSEVPSDAAKEMIEHYRVLCQRSWIELHVAQDALFAALIGEIPENMGFRFDFERSEVTCWW